MFSGLSTTPPPVAMTVPARSPADATASDSSRRNTSSPSSAKMRATDLPARSSTSASVSTNARPSRAASARPTAVFPVPMKPMSTTL